MSADLEVLKEIPGYQAILKAVLKSQIQMLVEQLSSQTGEESVILTASITDGTLCHLGSDSGKMFLEDREEFKSQFLGFCLKRHHKRKSPDIDTRPGPEGPEKRARNTSNRYSPIHTASTSVSKVGRNAGGQGRVPQQTETLSSPSLSLQQQQQQQQQGFQDSSFFYDQDQSVTTKVETPTDDIHASNTVVQGLNQAADESSVDQAGVSADQTVNIKTEPEDDLEITGVELMSGDNAQSDFDQSQWAGNMSNEAMGYLPSTSGADGSYDQGDQSFSNRSPDEVFGYHGYTTTLSSSNLGRPLTQTAGIVHKHQCVFCPKSFKKKIDLKRHIRSHTGEKPFQCDICTKRFTQKSHMFSHRMVHLKRNEGVCAVTIKTEPGTVDSEG